MSVAVTPERRSPAGTADDGPEEAESEQSSTPRWVVFAIVVSALFMGSLDTTIVSTALPDIHRSLRASINWAAWSMTIYTLGMVVALPIAGKAGDLFGRRKIFFIGVALFTGASLACGLAPDISVLLVCRAVQAVGAGIFTPSAAGIIAGTFGSSRDRAIGMFGTVQGAGQLIGPILGGVLVGYLSWRWIFFVNVPIGAALLALVLRFMPESSLRGGAKADLRGLLLMSAFVLIAMFGISAQGSSRSTFVTPGVIVPELVAIAFALLFVRHTRHAPDPFVPMRLLKGRGFGVMNIENFFWGVVGYGVAALVPLYARERYHFSALDSGTLLTARAMGMIAMGGVATFALRRTGVRPPLIAGLSLVAAGVLMMSVAPRFGIDPYAWLSIGAGLTGLGNGAVNPALRNACLQLEPESVTAITGLRTSIVYIGFIISVGIVTDILNRSAEPGIVQSHVMWVIVAIILVLMVPLTARVPEHKGSW